MTEGHSLALSPFAAAGRAGPAGNKPFGKHNLDKFFYCKAIKNIII